MPDRTTTGADVPSLDAAVGPQKGGRDLPAVWQRWERPAIVIAAALQVIFLVGMILAHTIPYRGAHVVLLRVEPVDPRDLLRGDYVTLGYEMSRLPYGAFQPGQKVYATLVPEADGRHHRLGALLTAPPTGVLFIEGTATNSFRADYGIESFYVQEKTGHDYENAVREHRLWAEVAVSAAGHAKLRGLMIE